MKRTIPFALILLAVWSCSPGEAVPAVFEINPGSLTSEVCTAHSTTITVRCDMDCTFRLKQGTWLSVSATKPDAQNKSKVTLAMTFNDTPSTRKDTLVISTGSDTRHVAVHQIAMKTPGGAFFGSVPGMYLPDGNSFTYAKYSFQKAKVESSTSKTFRIVEASTRTLLQLSNLPFSYTPGEKVSILRYQNAVPSLPETADVSATVFRTDGDTVWLVDGSGIGYILEK